MHHRPEQSPHQAFSALTAVHVADALEHEYNCATAQEEAPRANEDYLEKLGLLDRFPIWRQECEGMVAPAQL